MAGEELCRGGGLVSHLSIPPRAHTLLPSSVTQLTNILRQAVEEEDPLSQEITIPGKTLFINGVSPSRFPLDYLILSPPLQSVLIYEEAPPHTPPLPPEAPPIGVFSVAQLTKLQSQLFSVAPDGLMLAQSFVQTLHGFTENTVNTQQKH